MNEQLQSNNSQFENIMQTNFSPEEQVNFELANPMESYLDALAQQNLQFGTLSTDDPYTRDALKEPAAVEALLAPNLAVEALGQISMYATDSLLAEVQAREDYNRLFNLFLDDDDETRKKRHRRDISYSPTFASSESED